MPTFLNLLLYSFLDLSEFILAGLRHLFDEVSRDQEFVTDLFPCIFVHNSQLEGISAANDLNIVVFIVASFDNSCAVGLSRWQFVTLNTQKRFRLV